MANISTKNTGNRLAAVTYKGRIASRSLISPPLRLFRGTETHIIPGTQHQNSPELKIM